MSGDEDMGAAEAAFYEQLAGLPANERADDEARLRRLVDGAIAGADDESETDQADPSLHIDTSSWPRAFRLLVNPRY